MEARDKGMPKGAKLPEDPTCQCGAKMLYYKKTNEEGWFCPVCQRKRPVISSHMKPVRR